MMFTDLHSELYKSDQLHYYQERESTDYSERKAEAMRIISEIKTIKRYPQWQANRNIYKNTLNILEQDFKRVTGDTIVLYHEY